ncbi:MAG TPA: hypothetical protein VEA60_15810 [Allosphingosinicella sp.]|nr:hypothetical protein [Allosphingosinicella sp.]
MTVTRDRRPVASRSPRPARFGKGDRAGPVASPFETGRARFAGIEVHRCIDAYS